MGAAALAVGLALAGCSSDKDVPPTVASSPSGGTQANTDTGSGGEFPDVNTTPTQRPTSTIQDLQQAPEGLSGAQSGTQYGEPLVGGPSDAADRPAPPPEPDPAADLPPIPEAQSETTTSAAPSEPDTTIAEAPPVEEPAVEEPAVEEPVVEEPVVEEPVAEEPVAEEPTQTADATTAEPAPDSAAPSTSTVEAAPMVPMAQPVTPVGTPQEGSQPFSPEAQLALAPGSIPTQGSTGGYGAVAPAQAAPTAYGPNYAALAPDAYGVQFPQPALPPYQPYDPSQAQAMYRSPYVSPPTNYGGAVVSSQSTMVAPAYVNPSFVNYGAGYYAPGYYGGQPVGMIYFRDGSSRLSSDDRKVLKQIAEMQQAYGGVVRIVGHASMRTHSMDYARHQQANQRISEARAKAVARQLMRYGVPEGAIVASAAGDAQPLYAEVMPNGEAANRRAEVYLSAY